MAGPNRTYWRKETPSSPITKTAINSLGKIEEYKEHTQFQINHIPGNHVMNSTTGICTSNSGMHAEYYRQGREDDTAGKQGIYHGDTGLPK